MVDLKRYTISLVKYDQYLHSLQSPHIDFRHILDGLSKERGVCSDKRERYQTCVFG